MRPATAFLLLLTLVLSNAAFAAEAPKASMPAAAESRLAVSIPSSLVIRVDEKNLIPARDAQVFEERQAGALTGILLGFDIDRTEIIKLRPPFFDMKTDGVTLLSFDPALPVRVLVRARPDFLAALNGKLKAGEGLDTVAAAPGDSGFPMLFDLENYSFYGVIQGQGGAQ